MGLRCSISEHSRLVRVLRKRGIISAFLLFSSFALLFHYSPPSPLPAPHPMGTYPSIVPSAWLIPIKTNMLLYLLYLGEYSSTGKRGRSSISRIDKQPAIFYWTFLRDINSTCERRLKEENRRGNLSPTGLYPLWNGGTMDFSIVTCWTRFNWRQISHCLF